jgi:prepilin-type N-terminal cleavage/methylation domain-containing protein
MVKKGFTLIELIVVIAIIAILAAVIAPNAFRAIEKSKIARLQADMKNVKTAAVAYYSDVGLWPPDVCPEEDPGFIRWDAYFTSCPGCGGNASVPADYQKNWDGPYLEKFPFPTPWGGSYDWEWWPNLSWMQPPGTYVSVRPKFTPVPLCAYVTPSTGSVPPNYEIKLQKMGVDVYIPSGVNTSDGTIITEITKF